MHDTLLHLEDDDMELVMYLRSMRYEDLPREQSPSPMNAKEVPAPEEPRVENNRNSCDQEALSSALNNILVFSGPGNSRAIESESGISSYETAMDLSKKTISNQKDIESGVKQCMNQMDTGLKNTALDQSSINKPLKEMNFSPQWLQPPRDYFAGIDIDMICRWEEMF